MSGQPRRTHWYRFRARPDRGQKFRLFIQRRRWFLFIPYWVDWYPVENAVRALHHEAIELYERLDQIVNSEIKDATAYVEATYVELERMNLRTGKGTPFKDVAMPRETVMPDVSKQYEEIAKFFKAKGGRRPGGGTKTTYLGKFGRNDLSLLNREKLSEEYDHVVDYRPPRQEQKSNKGRNRQRQQKQQDNQD